MITISYEQIMRDGNFMSGLRKLRSWTGYKDSRIALNMAKIAKLVDAELKTAQEVWEQNLKAVAKKDENGKPLTTKNERGHEMFDVPDDKQGEWSEYAKTFFANTFEVNHKKLFLHDLTGCPMSPDELIALECFLTETQPDLKVAKA